MPFNLGFGELLVVLVVALLVFGGRLPEVARSLGQGVRQFKEGLKSGADADDEDEDDAADEETPIDRSRVTKEENE